MFNTIEDAIKDLKQGKMVIVCDDESRENEGDLILPAECVTPEAINFMASYGKGLICAPISNELAKKLELPPMVAKSEDSHETAFTISIDADRKHGTSTGISAKDRSIALSLLTNDSTCAGDFVRPGHIFPLIAKSGGVLERPGHTEAAIDLAKLAGKKPVGVICEILKADGECARVPDLEIMANEWNLKLITIEDLIKYLKNKG